MTHHSVTVGIAVTLVLMFAIARSQAQQNGVFVQDSEAHSVSVMKSVGPDGTGAVTVVTDGVPQSFTVATDGTLIDENGQAVANLPGVVPGAGKPPPGAITIGPNGGPFNIKQAPDGGAKEVIEKARQRADEALKEALGCSDAEWEVLRPKIERVQLLQSAAGERGGGIGLKDSTGLPPSVAEARARLADFQKAVSNKESSDASVVQALVALRQARGKVRAELVTARKELTDLVTPRQEAILYQRGILTD